MTSNYLLDIYDIQLHYNEDLSSTNKTYKLLIDYWLLKAIN